MTEKRDQTAWVGAVAASLLCLELLRLASAKAADSDGLDLLKLSLEELGSVQVTSVSRKSENLSSAAAAIQVISQEDLRRSGVTQLGDALRTVPGMQVARANSRQWAISARGFNSVFASKLLVLLDGRTLYTPLFSGVFWEEHNPVLEDLDRVEVIRGPGATLWGANAVNGVINITSKSARETQGTLISGAGGLEERALGAVRYGGQLRTNVHYRVYGTYANRDEFTRRDGSGARDDWWISQGGFRLDGDPSDNNHWTVQGDYFYADIAAAIRRRVPDTPILIAEPFRSKTEGGNLLGRWTHEFGPDSDLKLQAYYDRTDRDFQIGREIRDTVDFDAQHRFAWGERQEIVWGGGYRFSSDQVTQSPDFRMRDANVGLQLASAFIQDEIELMADRLRLTLGSKIEHHDFTGWEAQPSGRLAWTPHPQHTLWTSVSRAVRTPSRAERGLSLFLESGTLFPNAPIPILLAGHGNPQFGSEELIAYELGYRVNPHPRLMLDWAAFYNDYDRVQSVRVLPPELAVSPGQGGRPYLIVPVTFGNDVFGEGYGAEASATWQPLDSWRLKLAYTFLKLNLHTRPSVQSLLQDTEIGNPEHQVFLWSDVDLGPKVEWGLGLRYVDCVPNPSTPAYMELDTRLAWKPKPNLELALIGRNLIDSHHPEAASLIISPRGIEVDRSIYAKFTLRF